MLSFIKKIIWLILLYILVASNIWALAIIWFDCALSYRDLIVLLFATICLYVFVVLPPSLFKLFAHLSMTLVVFIWWFPTPASNERIWDNQFSRLAEVVVENNKVDIKNFRNFSYEAENGGFSENWEERSYDLNQLSGVDIFFTFNEEWPNSPHIILSWQFENSTPLAISFEARREKLEDYSAMMVFFQQYELFYLIGSEQDLVRHRAFNSNEQVFLYRLSNKNSEAKEVLKSFLQKANDMHEKPAWYYATNYNTYPSIRNNLAALLQIDPFSWELFLPSYLPEMLYKKQRINYYLPFKELQEISNISTMITLSADKDNFSEFIRKSLPERPQSASQTEL